MTMSWTWRHPSTHPPHSSQSPTMRTISLHNPSATMPRGLRKHVWSGARSGAHNLLLTILTTSSEDVGDVSFTLHPFSSHPPDDILGSKTSGSTCYMKLPFQFVCNPSICQKVCTFIILVLITNKHSLSSKIARGICWHFCTRVNLICWLFNRLWYLPSSQQYLM